MNSLLGMPADWKEWDLWFKKYIDDGLAGEVVGNLNAVSHITAKKEKKYVHAAKSQNFMKLTMQNPAKIGMRINTEKTKMMCVNVAKNSIVNTYIKIDGKTIEGGDEIQILGYKIGRELHAEKQVHREKVLHTLMDSEELKKGRIL